MKTNSTQKNGKYKHENIPEDFEPKEYKELNEDLQHLADLEAKNHYEYSGYRENRKYKYENTPEDFEPKEYKELNEDLQHLADLEAKNHYEYSGYRENRKYKYENTPEDFEPKEYKELNEDLQHLTDLEAKNHYEYSGYIENRKYKYENTPEDYNISKQNLPTKFFSNKLCAHLHCFNINKFSEYYHEYIDNISKYFYVIVTYSEGNKIPNYDFIFLKIENKGMDVGGKIQAIKYLNDLNIKYEYILMLHSKKCNVVRKLWMEPFCLETNLKIISQTLKNNNNIGIIINNYTLWNNNIDLYNSNYIEIFLKLCGLDKIPSDFAYTSGNMYIINYKVIETILPHINNIYNMLNFPTSIDKNWIKSIRDNKIVLMNNNIPCTLNLDELEECIKINFINKGIYPKDIYPDGMIEHAIERIILYYVTKICKLDFLLINKNIIDMVNIKFDAIYFPQFHEFHENNNFWGKGFTEWTLLKPFENKLIGNNYSIDILKPHDDIGYYELDLCFLKKQIEMAETNGINSFMIYHYWFANKHKVMYKVLEYFLLNEIKYNFYLCWANEPWTRKWSGGQEGDDTKMLEQTYDAFEELIEYLIPFFKKPNYQRNEKGELIYLIYNIEHLSIKQFKQMKQIWESRLKKEELSIAFVFYDNFPQNENIISQNNLNNFIFEPMNSNYTIKKEMLSKEEFIKNIDEYYDSDIKFHLAYDIEILWEHYKNYGYKEGGRIKYNGWNCMNVNYHDIINKYESINISKLQNSILGLPLNWNNIVRRKDSKFLYVSNFNEENMEKLIIIFCSKILMKYINVAYHTNYDNRILINAWNEWNEQAILEPNSTHGYANLNVIKKYIYSNAKEKF